MSTRWKPPAEVIVRRFASVVRPTRTRGAGIESWTAPDPFGLEASGPRATVSRVCAGAGAAETGRSCPWLCAPAADRRSRRTVTHADALRRERVRAVI